MSRSIRAIVAHRAGHRCEYCKSPERFSPDSFAIDHIVPVSRDGSDDVENLAFSCLGCNGAKHDAVSSIDPKTDIPAPLFHPRQYRWTEHFRWTDDYLRVEGITATDRATVARLQLNREGVVNLRRLLVAIGEDPPPARNST